MGLEFKVSGAERFHRLADLFKELDNEGLGREMARALTKAVDPLGKAITEEAGKAAPGGYRGTLTASMKHRRSVRNTRTQASVRLTTTAKGVKENRDLPAINAGRLRHPVFGRRRSPWSTTRVRSGFYDRGIAIAGPKAEKQLLEVLDHYQQIVTGG